MNTTSGILQYPVPLRPDEVVCVRLADGRDVVVLVTRERPDEEVIDQVEQRFGPISSWHITAPDERVHTADVADGQVIMMKDEEAPAANDGSAILDLLKRTGLDPRRTVYAPYLGYHGCRLFWWNGAWAVMTRTGGPRSQVNEKAAVTALLAAAAERD